MANDLSLHVGRERCQRHDCWHGWSYGVWMAARQRAREAERRDQIPLFAEEAGKAAEWGLQLEFINTLCELAWELTTTARFRLPSWRATGWTRRFRLPGNAKCSGSLSNLHVSFCSHFTAHARKS